MAITSVLIVCFFAVMIIIGIRSRKHATDVNGFVLGSRSVGPWLSAFAFGTSYFSAVIFVGYAGQFGWTFGLASTWIGLGNAFIGSLLAIKPIIHVDNEGKLVAYAKVRGRKKALRTLLEDSQKDILDPSATDVIIAHADCIDDAKAFADAVKEKYPAIRSVSIMELGPVIGCHVGPGLIAMIYMASAKDRIA